MVGLLISSPRSRLLRPRCGRDEHDVASKHEPDNRSTGYDFVVATLRPHLRETDRNAEERGEDPDGDENEREADGELARPGRDPFEVAHRQWPARSVPLGPGRIWLFPAHLA